MSNSIYFNQSDSRWAKHPYTSTSHPKATVSSGGCGPTCAAMVVSNLKETVYPDRMADLFKRNNLRGASGTLNKAFDWVANKWGLQCSKTVYIQNAIDCLKRGGIVVALCHKNKYNLISTGGHFVVLAGLTGLLKDTLIIYDPSLSKSKYTYNSLRKKVARVEGNKVLISVKNFKKYCDYDLWCYEPLSKYKPGEMVVMNAEVGIAYAQGAETLVQCGDQQFWAHSDEIHGNRLISNVTICFAQGTSYIVQYWDQQFWLKEKDIEKKVK